MQPKNNNAAKVAPRQNTKQHPNETNGYHRYK